MCLQSCFQVGQFRLSTYEAGGGRAQVSRSGFASSAAETRCAGRALAPGTSRRVWRYRVIALLPARSGRQPLMQPRRRSVEQDLTAVAGRHHPRSAIEYRAEVVALRASSASPVAMPIRTGNSRARWAATAASTAALRRREHRTHAVTGVLEQPAVVCLDRIPQLRIVSRECRPHRFRRRPPIAGSNPRCR